MHTNLAPRLPHTLRIAHAAALLAACCMLGLTTPTASAQQPIDESLVDPSTPRLSAEDLQELVAPIALYPDTLLANVLAACVYPDDLKAAAAHVAGGKPLDDPAASEWDPSVVTVAGVPDALKMLTDYPEWMESIGQAFLVQGPDVMTAVQTLRARAWANGALQSTPQQTVVTKEQTIIIEPAEPTVIYVPRYDPQVVYVEKKPDSGRVAAAVIGFGVGVAVGALFADMDCDWRYRHIHWGWRRPHHHWHSRPNVNININRPTINIRPGDSWRPRPDRPTTLPLRPRPGVPSVTPSRPVPGRPTIGQLQGIGSGARPPIRVPGRVEGSRPVARPGVRPTITPQRPGITTPTMRPSAPTTRPTVTQPPSPGASRPGPTTPGAFPRPPAASPGLGNRPATQPRPTPTPAARPTPQPRPTPTPAARPSPQPNRPAAAPASRPAPRPSGLNPGAGSARPTARPAPRPAPAPKSSPPPARRK